MRLFFFLIFSISSFAVPFPPERAPSPPFVTGDGFRAYSDFVYDEIDSSLNPSDITQPGSTIFVRASLLKDFFPKIHPLIAVPYILITHISDESVPGSYAPYLDDPKLIAWFAMNYDGTTSNPKLHPIPIGIANRIWPCGKVEIFVEAIRNPPPKKHLASMNLTLQTNFSERWKVFKHFAFEPFCYRTGKKPFAQYLVDAAASEFVISPTGFGLDTYRLWEALYLGCIPVVRTSSLDSLYEGLPVLIIQDWSEVTEGFLRQKLGEMKGKKYNLEKLELDYWLRLIESYKHKMQFAFQS